MSPTHPTTYELTAKGPGGTAEQTVTVNVNAQPTATLALSQPEVRYHKIGDKVVEQDSATLNWSASNANNVTIQPLGSVATSGSQNIEATPDQTSTGPVNRDVTYTLTAANACGGTATRTATLHVVGSIDPAPPVTLASVFYPTAYPERRHPQSGSGHPARNRLSEKAATTFKKNEQYDNEHNKLMVVGHADVRGPEKYNMALSERRADAVKDYLVSQGIRGGANRGPSGRQRQATGSEAGRKSPIARHSNPSKMDDQTRESNLACVQPPSRHHS